MFRRTSCIAAALAAAMAMPAVLCAQVSQQEYAQRRATLVAQLPNDAVVVAIGAREPAQDYLSFYQASSFQYLTGFLEPDAAMVIVKHGNDAATTMFVLPRDPGREVWTGMRLGTEGVHRRTSMPGRSNDELPRMLDSVANLGVPMYVIGDFPDGELAGEPGRATSDQQMVQLLQGRHPKLMMHAANAVAERLRGTKSETELALIRQAADITVIAQREAMQALEPGMNEFEVQGLIEYTFRRNGADRPSFATIVGSGPNSTTLHYNADNRYIAAGDVVVMDIGASYRGYAADVTRTIPASGTFSPEQRDIYRVVREAQSAGERTARATRNAGSMNDAATQALAAGLARLGLIESPDATYDCAMGGGTSKCAQYRLYYMHGLGHGIGLEVHDPDQFYFNGGRLVRGSAFTIEPGVYVRADVLETLPDTRVNRAMIERLRPAVQKYANIGVRIEDNYIVTGDGVEWISRAPREIEEIEALMAQQWAGPARRDSAVVDEYRQTAP